MQQCRELTGLSSSLQASIPQLYFDVDRDRVKMLGMPMADVFSTMKAYTGSVYVNLFKPLRLHLPGIYPGRIQLS